MASLTEIEAGADVIGADGVHVGVVDHVAGDRLKLARHDSSDDRHHYIDRGLIADVEEGTVRLSANADVAILFEETDVEKETDDKRLDEGLEETFPASDPVSAKHIT